MLLRARNTPEVALVHTTTGYRVLLLTPEAVTCVQLQLMNGYTVVVTPPIEKATGSPMVAVSGIA